MKLIEGLGNIFLFSFVAMLAYAVAAKHGYAGGMPSRDAQYIVDGLIMAGTLASGK